MAEEQRGVKTADRDKFTLGARAQTWDSIRFLSLSSPRTHHSPEPLHFWKKASQNIVTEFLCVTHVEGQRVDERNGI